jgi:predicted Fe-Mo cluster-binding NifX family protein
MKLCFPVEQVSHIESEVYGHFGSSPSFMIVDSETGATTVIDNAGQAHEHGMCNPVAALEGHEVDIVVVGGIGRGALLRLNGAGISVYQATGKTVRQNIELFKAKRLPRLQPEHVCTGHSGGCSH